MFMPPTDPFHLMGASLTAPRITFRAPLIITLLITFVRSPLFVPAAVRAAATAVFVAVECGTE